MSTEPQPVQPEDTDQHIDFSSPGVLVPGTVLDGTYKVLDTLGSGGMGTVYLCEQIRTERQVAVKLLHYSLSTDQALVKRFRDEARALSRLDHSAIVKVLAYGISEDGRPFMVMEALSGKTLAQTLAKEQRLAPERIVSILRQVLSGLVHAHSKGIIHRDLKPSNIMLCADDQAAKIMDFGIAKAIRTQDQTTTATPAGSLIGSPPYMSPEQCLSKAADARSDLYSIGCIVYECLIGQPPFSGESGLEIIYKQIHEPPPPVAERSPDNQTRALSKFVNRCLQKNPHDRFASAEKALAVLSGETTHRLISLTDYQRLPLIVRAGLAAVLCSLAALALAITFLPQPKEATERYTDGDKAHQDTTQKTAQNWIDDATRCLHTIQAIDQGKKRKLPDRSLLLKEGREYAGMAIATAKKSPHLTPREALQAQVKAYVLRAKIERYAANNSGAVKDFQQALALCDQHHVLSPTEQMEVESGLIDALVITNQTDAAIAMGKRLLSKEELSSDAGLTRIKQATLLQLVSAMHATNQIERAIPYAKALWEHCQLEKLPQQIEAVQIYGYSLYNARHFKQALSVARIGSKRIADMAGEDYPNEGECLAAQCLIKLGRSSEGLRILQSELDKTKASSAADKAAVLTAMDRLQDALCQCSRRQDAIKVIDEAIALLRSQPNTARVRVLGKLHDRSVQLRCLDRNVEAEATAREALKLLEQDNAKICAEIRNYPELHLQVDVLQGSFRMWLAQALEGQHRYDEATATAERALELLEQCGQADAQVHFDATAVLLRRAIALGKRDEIKAAYERLLKHLSYFQTNPAAGEDIADHYAKWLELTGEHQLSHKYQAAAKQYALARRKMHH